MKTNRTRRLGRTATASVLAAALLFGVGLLSGQVMGAADAAGMPQASPSNGDAWGHGPSSFSELVERVKPAVVNISIKGTARTAGGVHGHPFGSPGLPEGSPFGDFYRRFFEGHPGLPGGGGVEREFQAAGSGFIISADGHVVTNNHVIEHADEIEVIMGDGTRYPAEVKGRDPKTDLALLQVDADESLPHVELGDSDHAKVGDWVVAVGNPFGLGGTVTAGIISARGRDIRSGPFDDFLQIDAPINRGNSGGPLFDAEGRVIGINTAIYSPSGGNVGIGFAIPSTMAKDIIAQLRTEGSVARGWLGVQIQPVTEIVAESLGLEEQQGALVASVVPDGPADRAGIETGDVILRMNGEELDDFKDLPKLVAKARAGSEATFEVRRQGRTKKLDVEIGRMPSDEVELALADGDSVPDSAKLGIQLAELTSETRERFGVSKESVGVLVAGVVPGSPASKAGIRVGSVIQMVGQEPVESPDEVVAKVKEAAKRERPAVLLLVEHRGETQFVAVEFAAA
jgi:serine protease Do